MLLHFLFLNTLITAIIIFPTYLSPSPLTHGNPKFVFYIWISIWIFCSFFDWVVCFCFFDIELHGLCIYILEINPSSVALFANIFSHSEVCLFVYVFFCCAKAFKLNQVPFVYFCFYFHSSRRWFQKGIVEIYVSVLPEFSGVLQYPVLYLDL